ncbi:MAG: YncE family protein [Gammaproteobacteria bacterium]
MQRSLLAALMIMTAAPGIDAAPASIGGCTSKAQARVLCGFRSPEDLAQVPGTGAVIVSEYGDAEGKRPGLISLIAPDSGKRRVLYRGTEPPAAKTPGWGDPACPGPAGRKFSPHGIDINTRTDGRLALAVVQHGRRESVELFEITQKSGAVRLTWRGCVVAPADAWMNDVALLGDGSLVATHMTSRAAGFEALFSGAGGPGHALHWSPSGGWRDLPGTEGRTPNGVEVSADDLTAFVVYSGEALVRRYDLASGRVTGRVPVPGPDNLTWTGDGKLIASSVRRMSAEAFAKCRWLEKGGCPIAFDVLRVDPESLAVASVYAYDGPLFGSPSVALQLDRMLLVGSGVGDRILRTPPAR